MAQCHQKHSSYAQRVREAEGLMIFPQGNMEEVLFMIMYLFLLNKS
jgi:hypothetical protein